MLSLWVFILLFFFLLSLAPTCRIAFKRFPIHYQYTDNHLLNETRNQKIITMQDEAAGRARFHNFSSLKLEKKTTFNGQKEIKRKWHWRGYVCGWGKGGGGDWLRACRGSRNVVGEVEYVSSYLQCVHSSMSRDVFCLVWVRLKTMTANTGNVHSGTSQGNNKPMAGNTK